MICICSFLIKFMQILPYRLMHIATIMANRAETNMENETKIKMKLRCSVSVLGMLRNTRVIHENRFGRLWNIT